MEALQATISALREQIGTIETTNAALRQAAAANPIEVASLQARLEAVRSDQAATEV